MAATLSLRQSGKWLPDQYALRSDLTTKLLQYASPYKNILVVSDLDYTCPRSRRPLECSYMVPQEGIEPPTFGLEIRPSTVSTSTKTIPDRVSVQEEAFVFKVQFLLNVPLK
jgi:hypothetical protein